MVTPRDVRRRRKWFRLRRHLAAVGGTYDDVEFAPKLEDEFIQVARIAVEDEDNNPTEIRIFIDGHGYNHPVAEETSPVAATLYWVRWPTYIVTGEKLVARFTGATAADNLYMYLEGWRIQYPAPVTEGVLGAVEVIVE